MTLIGYARVSRLDQDPLLQDHALQKAGCEFIFHDKASGALTDRPGLTKALEACHAGDTLVVWKLDRLGRSTKDLIARGLELERRGIGLCCLTQGIDTSTPTGRFMFHVLAAIAEMERDLTRERTSAAAAAAKAQGKLLGPAFLLSDDQVAVARQKLDEGMSVRRVAALFDVSVDTVYRRVGRPRRTIAS